MQAQAKNHWAKELKLELARKEKVVIGNYQAHPERILNRFIESVKIKWAVQAASFVPLLMDFLPILSHGAEAPRAGRWHKAGRRRIQGRR
jgi:hypothetical protein